VASDLQWNDQAPPARACEADWLAVQGGYLEQLRALQEQHHCPILLAGDVVDSWRLKPQAISELIYYLRPLDVWSIPGNHDLPEHNYEQLHRSAYWTLVQAGVLKHLDPREREGGYYTLGRLRVFPFPYGFPLHPLPVPKHDLAVDVALAHAYVWVGTSHRPGAAPADSVPSRLPNLKGYDVAVFGDNHIPFLVRDKWLDVFNCGTLLRRHADELKLRPWVGLIHANGRVEPHFLDTSRDQVSPVAPATLALAEQCNLDLSQLTEALGRLDGQGLNFASFVLDRLASDQPPRRVADLVRALLGGQP
jgi:hypothetical protein